MLCGELIDEDRYFCSNCEPLLERNDLDNICLSCGFEKSSCVCKYNVYRFNALVCVFKNSDAVKKVYYNYKFNKKQHYVNFFAHELSSAVEFCYKDVSIDFVCSVPQNKRFGYDHSGYLAKEISKQLKIPYESKVLSCVKKTKKQHRSTIKERLSNTEGKYTYNYKINGKNVLLVDDIKTTGATIDECAKMLLYAGAENVYCVTVIGTQN